MGEGSRGADSDAVLFQPCDLLPFQSAINAGDRQFGQFREAADGSDQLLKQGEITAVAACNDETSG